MFGVYGRAAGMLAMFTAFFSFCIFQAFSVAANFWLNNWTGDPNLLNASMTSDVEGLQKGNDFYLTIYGVLGIFQGKNERLWILFVQKVLHNASLY